MTGLALLAVSVMQVASPVRVDGVLDEAVWKDAAWCSDMKRLEMNDNLGPFSRKTEFAILADDRCVYVGVRCEEPDVDRLKGGQDKDLFAENDAVELFFGPTGSPFDFYHFAVSPVSKTVHSSFASEAGNIRPDPYDPVWSHAIAFEAGAWTAEFAFPLSSFYMTRNADWQTEWVFNLTRTMTAPYELASWSKLEHRFLEPKRFQRVGGFPMRKDADDFSLTDIQLSGRALELVATTAVPGEYEIEACAYGKPVAVSLKAGRTVVKVPVRYPRNGRFVTSFRCVRKADGAVFERRCPVTVDQVPIRVKLTTPAYRNNFYPGQKAEKVEGSVALLDGGEATVTLEGPGFATQTAKVADGGTFSFDVRGFATGDARLRVRTGKDEETVRVRNLPDTGRRMIWVEDGHLVVNGKPVLRRNLYAAHYRTGHRLEEMLAREDAEFHVTHDFDGEVSVQINVLVRRPGIERQEATKDGKPCPEWYAAVDKLLDSLKDRDYGYYYICDEPEYRGISRVYLKHMYDYVAEKDPYHPILMASTNGKQYLDCADWIEAHPYISPRNMPDGARHYGKKPSELGGFLDRLGCAGRPDKVIGFLPTCFAYRWISPRADYPTFDEYLLHTFAAMSHGGKSLWPYAAHDLGDRPALYEGTKYVFSSFDALDGFFLSGRRTDHRRGEDFDLVTYALGDDTLLLAMNYTRRDLEVKLPDGIGPLREFRGVRTFRSGDSVVLGPDETLVATARPHDAGLPTRAEVRARALSGERARLSRDNQLLERAADIDFKSNFRRYASHGYKLVDGSYDQLALGTDGQPSAFCQMTFRDGLRPRFDRAAVQGWGDIRNVGVSALVGGTWTKLAVVRREATDAYRTDLVFDRAVEAEGVRFEFPGAGALELYEIELPKTEK